MSPERRRTGQEALNRLFWDPRLNRDVFVVGYSDRLAPDGVREIPLVRWDPAGNIPWHRLLSIRCGDEVVWSREEGVDRLASDDLPAVAWLAEETPAEASGGLRSRAVYRQLGENWELVREIATPQSTSFRLLTWNILHDFGDPEIPSLDLRLPFLAAELTQAEADIVALQEVSPGFARALLALPRTEPLFVSESASLAGLDPHGPFLLACHSFSLVEHAAGARPVLVGTWKFADRLVHVANLHLPSNRTADAALHRQRLLSGLLADLQALTGDVLVVGDFNLMGDELAEVIATAGYRDVWNLLHPGEEGSTFDPPHNPLARQASRTGLPVRFDRVLWRPAENGFSPVSLELFATAPHATPEGPLFASDHYGLCSVWQSNLPRPNAQSQVGDLAPWLERLHLEASDDQQFSCLEIVEQLDTLVAEITGRTGSIHLAGSWRLGVAGPGSDVDAICLHPPQFSREQFFGQLRDRLSERAEGVCLVTHSRMPKLSFRLQGQSVDVLAASTALERLPGRATPADFSDAESWQAARAIVEADLLLELVERAMPLSTYRQLLRAVRGWARARQVDGNAWGYLGGFPWALLAAWTAGQPGPRGTAPDREAGPGDFLAHFFAVLAHHPWPQPVALTEEGRGFRPQGPRDRLPIIRPVEPFENTAYNITRSTAQTLRAEWSRAARLCEGGAEGAVLEQLLAPVDLCQESELFLVLSFQGDEATCTDLAGQIAGTIVGLLIDLERQLHLFVRPWPEVFRQGATTRIVLGLPAIRQRDRGAVRQRLSDFLDGLAGLDRVKWSIDLCDRTGEVLPGQA